MPDISKCSGQRCERRNECYRFTSKPNPTGWQTYFVASPVVENKCEFFILNKEETEEKQP